MNGRSPIVLVTDNHQFYEHPSTESAHAEAMRLATMTGRQAVVYVPVAVVAPPTKLKTERLQLEPGLLEWLGDDLPF